MAIFNDNKESIILEKKHTDWYSLLQFVVCKVNPQYYKNIRIEKDNMYENRYTLYWESLNDSHLWCYPFPEKITQKTLKKLQKNIPSYIKMEL